MNKGMTIMYKHILFATDLTEDTEYLTRKSPKHARLYKRQT